VRPGSESQLGDPGSDFLQTGLIKLNRTRRKNFLGIITEEAPEEEGSVGHSDGMTGVPPVQERNK